MDVTLSRARPREVPVAKPSAEQSYIPRVLLRDDDAPDGTHKARWMPSEKTPGASKHLLSGHANAGLHNQLEPPVNVSELDVERLQTVEDELELLETELDHFVHDFYVAAASFTGQARSQALLFQSLRKPSTSPHATP